MVNCSLISVEFQETKLGPGNAIAVYFQTTKKTTYIELNEHSGTKAASLYFST
jgi:hypothetical protein